MQNVDCQMDSRSPLQAADCCSRLLLLQVLFGCLTRSARLAAWACIGARVLLLLLMSLGCPLGQLQWGTQLLCHGES